MGVEDVIHGAGGYRHVHALGLRRKIVPDSALIGMTGSALPYRGGDRAHLVDPPACEMNLLRGFEFVARGSPAGRKNKLGFPHHRYFSERLVSMVQKTWLGTPIRTRLEFSSRDALCSQFVSVQVTFLFRLFIQEFFSRTEQNSISEVP